jgi:tetratricopeptide (TPR) repeat protein
MASVPKRVFPRQGDGVLAGGLRSWLMMLAVVGSCVAGALEAVAQQAVYARTGGESAQGLASRSLECLHRGEDAVSNDAKRSAYREGLDLATRAVQVDDTNADAHFASFANGGRLLVLDGATANPFNLLKVNRELDRVLALNPNHVDGLAAKGGMYRQLPWLLGGSLQKAADYLARAVALDPDALGSRIELAETYRDMGQPERGVPLLEQAMQVAERKGKQRQLEEARQLLSQLQSPRK